MKQDLSHIFFALSDPTRRAILGRLTQQPETIGALARPFTMSAPAISKHMRVLENAGLISRQVSGREHLCRLNPAALATAEDWIHFHREFWESRLDSLEELIRSEHTTKDE